VAQSVGDWWTYGAAVELASIATKTDLPCYSDHQLSTRIRTWSPKTSN
jgi:hypothetical protein